MSLARNSRVYIDPSVWVYYLFQKTHREHRHCAAFFSQIQNGEIVGIATDFVVTEIIGVLKRVISEANGRQPTEAEMVAGRAKIMAAMQALGIEIFSADDLAGGVFLTPHVFDRAAEIVAASGTTKGGDGYWRVAGGADALHVALSEGASSNFIVACDQGFKGVKANVTAVILREEYP